MKNRRNRRAFRVSGLHLLGAAGFVLACVALGANLLTLRTVSRLAEIEVSAAGRPQAAASPRAAAGHLAASEPASIGEPRQAPVVQPSASSASPQSSSQSALIVTTSFAASTVSGGESSVGIQSAASTTTLAAAGNAKPAANRGAVSRRSGPSNNAAASLAAFPGRAGGGHFPDSDMATADVPAEQGAIMAPVANSPIPAAFEALSPEARLSDTGKQQIPVLQDEFARVVEETGSSTDAGQWNKAVAQSNDDFRALYGEDAFLAQQIESLRNKK